MAKERTLCMEFKSETRTNVDINPAKEAPIEKEKNSYAVEKSLGSENDL